MRATEIRALAAELGVPMEQVARDVLISHILHATSAIGATAEVTFFGGTALSRTHLRGFRLSEDVDLLADDPTSLADRLDVELPLQLRRLYPGLQVDGWHRAGLTLVGEVRPEAEAGVRIQLVPIGASYRQYPVEVADVDLRYPGLPGDVPMTVPTAPAAAAMKLNAWADRQLPRDLADLWGLQQRGWLTAHAVRLAGEAAAPVPAHVFADETLPSEEGWLGALGAQMRTPPDRRLAFLTVRSAVAHLRGWSQATRWLRDAEEAGA